MKIVTLSGYCKRGETKARKNGRVDEFCCEEEENARGYVGFECSIEHAGCVNCN